jgi:hypothetical protein
MEIAITTECKITVVASLQEDGTVAGKVIGHMPYADQAEVTDAGHVPVVSAEVLMAEADLALVQGLLKDIAARSTAALGRKMVDARAEARRVALQMGELV